MIDFNLALSELFYQPDKPLLFNSAFFLYFILFFFIGYKVFANKTNSRILYVCVFSLYFFYKACGWYVGLVLLSAIVDFNLSKQIYITKNRRNKNYLLVLSLALNLGLLFYFKYTDFFIEIYNDFSNSNVNPLNLLLPVGISFYTFENISYTIDVYKGSFKPVKRFWDYLFFLSFFPKLMMGPIVRASEFIPQIRKNINLTDTDISKGLFLILTGCFKKIVISDYLSTHLVNAAFSDPLRYSQIECLLAVYGYAMVIYCDFSGYSDMALGIAKWMGIDINVNFLAPYQSRSITEFWRRWHISLSTWLRDYLYIPLGGNRKGILRTYLNLIVTMLIGGFWHGASWNFIFWGAMHGIALAVDKMLGNKLKFKFMETVSYKFISATLLFHFVCFLWIFFKAENFEYSWMMVTQVTSNFSLDLTLSFIEAYLGYVLILLTAFFLHLIPISYNEMLIRQLAKTHWILQALIMTIFIFIFSYFNQAEIIKPVYLQF
jgi:D-alanyl-lipoteichoic acid acyltransferase DltB (MBOAT superfamily)